MISRDRSLRNEKKLTVIYVPLVTNISSFSYNFYSYDGRIPCLMELWSMLSPLSALGVIQELICNIGWVIFIL